MKNRKEKVARNPFFVFEQSKTDASSNVRKGKLTVRFFPQTGTVSRVCSKMKLRGFFENLDREKYIQLSVFMIQKG